MKHGNMLQFHKYFCEMGSENQHVKQHKPRR